MRRQVGQHTPSPEQTSAPSARCDGERLRDSKQTSSLASRHDEQACPICELASTLMHWSMRPTISVTCLLSSTFCSRTLPSISLPPRSLPLICGVNGLSKLLVPVEAGSDTPLPNDTLLMARLRDGFESLPKTVVEVEL